MSLEDTLPDVYNPRGPHGGRETENFINRYLREGKITRFQHSDSLAPTSVASILFITPATDDIQFRVYLNPDAAGVALLSESPSATGGSAVLESNARRSSSLCCGITAASDPTITTVGTVIETIRVGSSGFKSASGNHILGEAWEPKVNTKYLLRYTAAATSNTTIGIVVIKD